MEMRAKASENTERFKCAEKQQLDETEHNCDYGGRVDSK